MRERLSIVLALALSLCLAGCGRAQSNQPELIRTQSATQPSHILPSITAPTGPLVAGPQGGTPFASVAAGADAAASPTPPTTPGLPDAELTAAVRATLTAGPLSQETPEAVPEEPTQTPAAAAEPALNERLFLVTCARYHLPHGRGVEGLYPALDGNPFVTGEPAPLIEVVLHGREDMPAFAARLSDDEVAAVLTYIRNAWSNRADPISPEAVSEHR